MCNGYNSKVIGQMVMTRSRNRTSDSSKIALSAFTLVVQTKSLSAASTTNTEPATSRDSS